MKNDESTRPARTPQVKTKRQWTAPRLTAISNGGTQGKPDPTTGEATTMIGPS